VSITFDSKSARAGAKAQEQLINILRFWGIHYFMNQGRSASTSKAAIHIPPVELIKRLAQFPDPRIRDASIALFLLHPELADAALEAYATSEPSLAEQIAVLLLATLYLQRRWSIRLAIAFGHTSNFPEKQFTHLWRQRQLPSPQCQHGAAGLEALQAREQARRNLPLNFIGDWQNQIDHLLRQEEAKGHPAALSNRFLELQDAEKDCNEMTMRQHVTKEDIEKFLTALGKTYHKPGRIYLAGGAALVHMGARPGATLDIDVVIEAANEDEMVSAIRRLVDQMQINIEFASPADFIPVPSQWMAHSRLFGRYGTIDAFYYDLYSLALSKISRGTERDLLDVRLLVQQKLIELEELDAAYHEIMPRMGKRPYINLDPQKFAERYAIIRQQLEGESQ
jgi:hypothetical protein